MGFIALFLMLLSVAGTALLYQIAKLSWKTPVPINLVGAFFCFCTIISLTGWLNGSIGLFSTFSYPSFPEVPYMQFVQLALMTSGIYLLPVAFRKGRDWANASMHKSDVQ